MARASDTLAERHAFLEGAHQELFGHGLENLDPDTLNTVEQTMADAAVLSDGDVRKHFIATERMVAAGAVGLMDVYSNLGAEIEPRPAADAAALQLLRRVLRREMLLRDLAVGIPVSNGLSVLDGALRGRAVTMLRQSTNGGA